MSNKCEKHNTCFHCDTAHRLAKLEDAVAEIFDHMYRQKDACGRAIESHERHKKLLATIAEKVASGEYEMVKVEGTSNP